MIRRIRARELALTTAAVTAFALLAVLLPSTARAVSGPSSSGTFLTPAWPDGTAAQEVNRVGQVLISHSAAYGVQEDYLWSNGNTTRLEYQGKPLQLGHLNDRGQVAGTVGDPMQSTVVRWDRGQGTALTVPGQIVRVLDINNRGQVLIASITFTPQFSNTMYLADGNSLVDLGAAWDLLGTSSPVLNEAGQVAGTRLVGDGNPVYGTNVRSAFFWSGGQLHDIGLGGSESWATDLNSLGQVTGRAVTATGATHAYVWSNGRVTDLNPPGAASSSAVDQNDLGEVVGTVTAADSTTRIFSWIGTRGTALDSPGEFGESDQVSGSIAVNNRSQVVVNGTVASSPGAPAVLQPVVLSRGRRIPLGGVDGAESRMVAVSDLYVVGYGMPDLPDQQQRAARWTLPPV